MTTSWVRVPIHGGRMVIDLAAWDTYRSRPWHVSDTRYAVNRGGKPKRTTRFHRLVAGTPTGLVTDHLNHDRLDNRRANLRVCTQKSNSHNRGPGTKGYCWDESKKKWIVRYKSKFYGRYETEQQAQRAYQLALSGVDYVPHRRKLYFLPEGVTKQFGKYRVRLQLNNQRIWLGQFATLDEAKQVLKEWQEKVGV